MEDGEQLGHTHIGGIAFAGGIRLLRDAQTHLQIFLGQASTFSEPNNDVLELIRRLNRLAVHTASNMYM